MQYNKRTFITVVVAVCGLAGVGVVVKSCNNAHDAQQIAKQTRVTEDRRVIENLNRAVAGADAKISSEEQERFLQGLGLNLKIDVTPTGDGRFQLIPRFVGEPGIITKEQLEKYAAENTTWIEED